MGWGHIDKCDRSSPVAIWIGVEPCETEAEGKARAAELGRADPTHYYEAAPYLCIPLFITRSRPATEEKK